MQLKLGFLKKNLAMDVEEFHLPRATATSPDRPKSPALSSGAHRAHYVIPYRIGGINRMVFEFTMLNRGKVILCAICSDGRS